MAKSFSSDIFALGIFGSPEKDQGFVLLMLQRLLTFLSWESLPVRWFRF